MKLSVPLYPEGKATLAYLKAMNASTVSTRICMHVTSPDSAVLGQIKEGFSFLIDWCDDLIAHGIDPQDVNQSQFLSWQVNSYIREYKT